MTHRRELATVRPPDGEPRWRVEHAQVGAVGLQRDRGGEVGRPVVVDQPLDQPGEVEPQRHREHLRAVLDRPLDAPEQHVGVAAAVVAEDLADGAAVGDML